MDKTKLKGVAALIAAAVAVILAAFLCMSFPMAEVHAAEYDVSDGPSLVCRMAEAQEGDIIRLQDSITIDLTDEATVQSMYGGRVEANKDLYLSADTTYPAHSQTLDLNGKTLTIITGSDKSCFTLEGAITLTIIDSSAERTGAIVGHSNGSLFYSGTAESSLVLQDVAVKFTEYTEGGASITPTGAVIDTVGDVTLNNVTYTPAEGDPALIEDNAGAQVSYIVNTAEELAAAVADSSYSTVMLGADITQNITVEAGRTLTLDLNGHTLTAAAADETAVVSNYGALTIVNTDTANTGAIQSTDGSTWYTVFNEGTMTIGAEGEGYGELEVKNNSASSPASLVENNYDCSAEDPATLMIVSGTFTASGACLNAVKNDGYGICTIYGGTFTNEAEGGAAVMSAGTMTIYDGTFVQESDAAISNVVRNTGVGSPVAIEGGSFTGELYNEGADGFTVSGGTFDRTFSMTYLTDAVSVWFKDGDSAFIVAEEQPAGTTQAVAYIRGGVFYATLQDAINDVSDSFTKEISLAADAKESVRVPAGVEFDFRMSGYSLTSANDSAPAMTVNGSVTWINEVTGTISGKSGVLVKEGGVAYIKQSTTITFTGETNLSVEAGGEATVENGIFNGAIVNNDGTIELSGGTYAQKPAEEWLASGYGVVEQGGEYTVGLLYAEIAYMQGGQQVTEDFTDWAAAMEKLAELEGTITVKLYRQIGSGSAEFVVNEGQTVTLDQNGKSFSANIKNNGTLTITGSTGSVPAEAAEKLVNNGTLKIEGGKFNITSLENTGDLTIYGGSFGKSRELIVSMFAYFAEGVVVSAASDGYVTVKEAAAEAEVVCGDDVAIPCGSLSVAQSYSRYFAGDDTVTISLLTDASIKYLTFMGSAAPWTIDLNGRTLTVTSNYGLTFGSYSMSNRSFTVMGGTIVLTTGASDKYAINVKYGATLALDDVNVEFTGTTPFADMINVADNGTLNIESGSYYGGITRTNGTITIAEGCVFEEDIKDILGDGLTQNESGMVVKDGAENAVAMIETADGIVYYDTLQAAINAAESGATVTLLNNVDGYAIIRNSLTLNLNGKTISSTSDAGNASITVWIVGATSSDSDRIAVTIENGTIRHDAASESSRALIAYGAVDVTITSVTIENLTPNAFGAQFGNPGVTTQTVATVNNSTISGEYPAVFVAGTGNPEAPTRFIANSSKISGAVFGIMGNGSDGYENTSIELHNTTVTADSKNADESTGIGIYQPQIGTLLIDGGSVTGVASAVEIRSGSLTVTGGAVLKSTAENFHNEPNATGTTTVGAAVAVSQHTTNNPIKVTIEDATLTGIYALYENDVQDPAVGDVEMSVTGGEFNGKVYSENVTGFITDGTFSEVLDVNYLDESVAQIEADGTFTVGTEETLVTEQNAVAKIEETGVAYTSLQDAIDAADSGATVTLLKDLTESVSIAEGQEIVLDLNGCTLTNSGTNTIVNNGTLTVTGNGKVDNTVHQGAALQNNGKATLENGTFTRSKEAGKDDNANGNSWYVIDNSGTLTLKKVTVYQGTDEVNALQWTFSSTIRNKGASAEQMAVMEVDGATVVSGRIALKNDDWGKMTIADANVTGGNQAVQNWAQLEISGGTFAGDVVTWFYAMQGSEPETRTHATITGGTFNGRVMCVDYDQNNEGKVEIDQGVTISGTASFSEMPKYTYFANDCIAVWDEDSEMYVTAQGDWAAVINDETAYATLGEALAEAEDGDTVALLTDANGSASNGGQAITITKNITLDLNGHTITESGFTIAITVSGADVTLTSTDGTGKLDAIANGIQIRDGANVTVSNIEITANYLVTGGGLVYDGRAVEVVNSTAVFANVTTKTTAQNADKSSVGWFVTGSDVTVNDSEITIDYSLSEAGAALENLPQGQAIQAVGSDLALNKTKIVSNDYGVAVFGSTMIGDAAAADSADAFDKLTVTDSEITAVAFAITGNGSSTYAYSGTNIIITGSTLTSSEGAAIYHPQYGVLTIAGSGNKITGATGIEMRAGELTVEGGTITATGDPFAADPNGSGSTTTGAAVAIVQHTTEQPIKVTLAGGTYNGIRALYQANLEGTSSESTARISASVTGGTFNGAVESDNLTGFITGGSFKQQPAEELFDENYAAEYQNGYYVAVRSDALKTARANAQADVRGYAAANGISWLALAEEAAPAEGEEPVYTAQQAADILAAFNAIDSAMTQLAVAEARLAAMNAVDAYIEALDTYKLDMIGDLQTAAADDEETADVDESVVLPTATYSAIYNATSASEIDFYVENALAEIEAIRSLRTEISGQTQQLADLAEALEAMSDGLFGDTESGTQGAFAELFDKVQTAISDAQNAIVNGEEGSTSLSSLQEHLTNTINQALKEIKDALTNTETELEAIKKAIDNLDVSDQLADEFKKVTDAIIAAQDAITGSTGGEGGTSIGEAIKEINGNTATLVNGLREALIGENGTLTQVAAAVQGLTDLNIGGEFDGVLTAITNAQNAIMGVTEEDADGVNLSEVLGAVNTADSVIDEVLAAVQGLADEDDGIVAQIKTELKVAQDDLGSLTGALAEMNSGLAKDIAAAQSAIDAITTAIGSLGTDNEELAAQIGSVVDSLESVQGAVDEIGSNLGVAVDIEETKTNAVADLEVWLNAYLDTLLGTTTDEAESGVVMLAVTLETEDGDLYGRLTQAYSEANAQLILKYYNQALTAIDNATSTTDVSTAVSTFRAQVASVDAAAQNTPSMTGVYVLLAIVLVVLIAASIVVILKNRKAAAAVAAQPAAEAAAEEKPAEEAKPEAAEEAAEEGSETEESAEAEKPEAEEELAADDDDKEQVVIAANVRSFAEAYVELSDEQRELFNKVKEYALGKEGTSEAKLSSGVCVKLGSKQVVKLAVRRGNPVALFVLENEMLKDFRRGAATQAKLKVRATELVLREEADLETAYTMVDLSVDQIKKDAEAAKERRREQRRERRKQRLAEEAARQAEHDGSED